MDSFKDEEQTGVNIENNNQTAENNKPGSPKTDPVFGNIKNIFADTKADSSSNVDNTQQAEKDNFNPDHYLDKDSLKRMKFGLWLSENRNKIIKAFTILLILISSGFFVFSIYNLFIYFSAGDPISEDFNDNLAKNQTQIIPLAFSDVSAFKNGEKVDLLISIKNENPRFYAQFDYCFYHGETAVDCRRGFILPASEKSLTAFGANLSGEGDSFSFNVSKISWTRISKEIIDYPSYYNERMNILVSDISFKPQGGSVSATSNSLEFTISNNTAFSYHDVPLNILIFSNTGLISINKYIAQNLYSGESRDVSLKWSGNLSSAKKVEIMADVDILNDGVFIKYGAN